MARNMIHQQRAIQPLAIPMALQLIMNTKQERIRLKQEQQRAFQQALNQVIMIYPCHKVVGLTLEETENT